MSLELFKTEHAPELEPQIHGSLKNVNLPKYNSLRNFLLYVVFFQDMERHLTVVSWNKKYNTGISGEKIRLCLRSLRFWIFYSSEIFLR